MVSAVPHTQMDALTSLGASLGSSPREGSDEQQRHPEQCFRGDREGEFPHEDRAQGSFVTGGTQCVDTWVQPELVEHAEQQQATEGGDLHAEHSPVHGREQLGGAVDVFPVQEQAGQCDGGDAAHRRGGEAAYRGCRERAAIGASDGTRQLEPSPS
jgi:hypothetical protein